MAKRSRQSFLKRQRERQRAEKAAEKRAKRLARRSGIAVEEAEPEPTPNSPFSVESQDSPGEGPLPEGDQPGTEDDSAERQD